MIVTNYTTWASEADQAVTSVWDFLLSCLMQILGYLCCLGRHKKQQHFLAWFHPFKFTHGILVETKFTVVFFSWYTWVRIVVLHILLLVKSRRRLMTKESTFRSGRGKSHSLGLEYPDEKRKEEGGPHLQHGLSSLLLLIFTCLALSCIYHSFCWTAF